MAKESKDISVEDMVGLLGGEQEAASAESGLDVGGMVSLLGGGEVEEPLDGDYQDLGLLEAAGQGAVAGVVNTVKAVPQVLGAIAENNPGSREGRRNLMGNIAGAAGAVGEAFSEDPLGATEATARAAGPLASAIAGAGLGSAVPGVGTIVGGIAGAIAGPAAFEGLLRIVEGFTGLDVQKKSLSQVVGEAGEGVGGAALAFGTGKVLKAGSQASRFGADKLRDKAVQIKTRRDPTEALTKVVTKHGQGISSKDIAQSARDAAPRIIERGTIMRTNKTLPLNKEGSTFQTLDDIITTKSVGTGQSLLDDVGKELDDAISQVGRKYSLKDVDDIFETARIERTGSSTLDTYSSLKKSIKTPALIAVGKKAGYDQAQVRGIIKAKSKVRSLTQEINEYGSSKLLQKGGQTKLSELQAQKESLHARIEEFRIRTKDVQLTPNEFWSSVKDADKIDWAKARGLSGKITNEEKIFLEYRKNVQDSFRAGLEGTESLDLYNKANKEFHGLATVSKVAKATKDTELGRIRDPQVVITKALKGIKNSILSDKEKFHSAADHFRAVDRAFDGDIPGAGGFEKLYKYLGEGGLPKAGKVSETIGSFFDPKTAAIFTRPLIATQKYMEENPEEVQSSRQGVTGSIERMANATEKLVSSTYEGIGKSESEKRAIMKTLASDPDTRPWLYLDPNKDEVHEGVDSYNGQPLAEEDAETYFNNLTDSDLNGFEKAERRKYYNKKGKFMPEPIKDQETDVDEAEVRKKIQIEKARESVGKFKKSTDVVKASKMSHQLEEREQRGGLQLVNFSKPEQGFSSAFDIVTGSEGGFVDDPEDSGGRTNLGVTQKTYNSYLRKKKRSLKDVANIPESDVRSIYKEFWKDSSADKLPWPLSAIVFDAAINSGPGRAVKQLQKTLGVSVDGRIGPETLKALDSTNVATLANAYLDERESFYHGLNKPKFLDGWLNRAAKMRRLIGGDKKRHLNV